MANQRKLEVLNGLERDLAALYTEVNEKGVNPIRLKEIKDEVIKYAELMDVTPYPNITEEDKKVLYKKDKVEQKLSQGYLKTRLPEVIKGLLDNVKKAIEQEQ